MAETLSYGAAIHRAMHEALGHSADTVVVGQGVSDHTAIFGTTEGLRQRFGPRRVIDTAIAEDGTTGLAVGLALNGVYPIQTHIRVDFLVLAMNQLVNLVAKYRYMYGGRFELPMLIRAVVGRSWGQGPQHSQSLQALFAHVPGLTVILPSTAEEVLRSYRHATRSHRGPVISIEHRFLYDLDFEVTDDPERDRAPFGGRVVEAGDDVTLVATSYMVQEAQRAARWLEARGGPRCEILDPHRVSDLDHELIFESVARTGRLLVADTDWVPYGLGAEVCRGVVTRDPGVLRQPVRLLGMAQAPCPTSHALEDLYYPHMGDIVRGVYGLVLGTDDHGLETPDAAAAKALRKAFRGPF